MKFDTKFQMNEDIKQLFKKKKNGAERPKLLEIAGPRGTGAELGLNWDKLLSHYITNKPMEERDRQVGEALEDALREIYPGIELLAAHFPLYGYMSDSKGKVYLWQGEVDAVGYYNGEYLIVEWKLLDILNYWTKEAETAYGAHLHQCLVYARLLQLHLQLSYRPKILIVPIHSLTGNQIHPGLFSDVPKQNKTVMSSYSWSVEMPGLLPRLNSPESSVFKAGIEAGAVNPETTLKELFRPEATVADLLKEIQHLKVESKDRASTL